ncbi:hypothetical protein M0R45_001524 [Rubus argutus]|uniref:Pentatricopeptide repeat-containing protein n=1 Tax=Rubus argutus TaxID=59490 RepID=A0AAW1VII2_RUBAR
MNQLSWTFQRFATFLKTCIAKRDLFTGEALHALYFKSLIPSSTYIYNHFILLYSKCGRLSSAWNAFDTQPRPQCPSPSTLSSLRTQKNRKPALPTSCSMKFLLMLSAERLSKHWACLLG